MGKKKTTTGYRHHMTIHFGLGHGPVDELQEIRVGGRTAWSGSQTSSGTIAINKPTLFGGDKQEGGIVGDLDVMMGEPTQTANSFLQALVGGAAIGYRGLFTLLFKGGQISANNPYPKPWSFRFLRVLADWKTPVFYPAKAKVGVGMNGTHIIYQLVTDPRGLGKSTGVINEASFQAAADTLHAENFGLCLRWARQGSVEDFIGIVVNHIGAVVDTDRETGQVYVTLVRDDYVPSALPELVPDDIEELIAYERPQLNETVNEIVVNYHDVVTNKAASTPPVQNLANIRAQGGVISQTLQYPGISNGAMALRVAMRELRSRSSLAARVTLRLKRSKYGIAPGMLRRWSWPKDGVASMVLRILEVDDGDLKKGSIVVKAAQDVFGLPATSYAATQPSGWVPPNLVPQPAPHQKVFEVPYRELARNLSTAELSVLPVDIGFVAAVGARPAGVPRNFQLATRVGSAAFEDRGTVEITPTAITTSAVSRLQTVIPLSSVVDLDLVVIGSAALLGDEICRIDATDPLAPSVTLARGAADTVPKAHAAGTRLWCYEVFAGVDQRDYIDGTTVDAKLLTTTGEGVLAQVSAPTSSVTLDQRMYRPYPPGKVQINGAYPPADMQGAFALTWTHRDRVLQDDQLIDHTASSIGPETGTTYTARIVRPDTTVARTTAGLTGTSWTYSDADALTDGPLQSFTLELYSVRSAMDSMQRHAVAIERHGLGFRLGQDLGGIP